MLWIGCAIWIINDQFCGRCQSPKTIFEENGLWRSVIIQNDALSPRFVKKYCMKFISWMVYTTWTPLSTIYSVFWMKITQIKVQADLSNRCSKIYNFVFPKVLDKNNVNCYLIPLIFKSFLSHWFYKESLFRPTWIFKSLV